MLMMIMMVTRMVMMMYVHMLKVVKLILEIDPLLCPVPSQNIIIMNITTIITIIIGNQDHREHHRQKSLAFHFLLLSECHFIPMVSLWSIPSSLPSSSSSSSSSLASSLSSLSLSSLFSVSSSSSGLFEDNWMPYFPKL